MQKASEWLFSFNTQNEEQIQAFLADKKQLLNSQTVTISITGGKGGVGKTSVSVKMAKELADMEFKVLLIDCDTNLANTAIKLGLPISNSFYSLVAAEKSFDECLHKDGSFHLLSACNGSVDLFDTDFRLEDVIVDIINTHKKDYDFILLDCPAGLLRETLTLNAYCDDRIFVVTPDKSSITDSYSLIKILSQKFGIKENHLLVNMYKGEKQFSKVVKTISETVENFLGCRTHILGGLPKAEIDHSRFDTFFLEDKENGLHRNFCKVVRRYTDQLSTSLCGKNNSFHTTEDREQEVH
jgi:flagellar biosynthesis protein FlhG